MGVSLSPTISSIFISGLDICKFHPGSQQYSDQPKRTGCAPPRCPSWCTRSSPAAWCKVLGFCRDSREEFVFGILHKKTSS